MSFMVTTGMSSLPWRPAVHDVVPQFQHSSFKVSGPFLFDLFHGYGHHESAGDPAVFRAHIHPSISLWVVNKSFSFPVTGDKVRPKAILDVAGIFSVVDDFHLISVPFSLNISNLPIPS